MSKKGGGVAGRRLASDDGYRREVKAAFDKNNEKGGDVLERCKRLNELLASDFLKEGSANGKAQLTEILGILNTGPKRPSFLDKPPATATAPQAPTTSRSLATSASLRAEVRDNDVDDLIGLLNEKAVTPCVSAESEARLLAEKLKKEDVAKAKASAAAAAAAAEGAAKAKAEAAVAAAVRAKAAAALAKAKAEAELAAAAKAEVEADRRRRKEAEEAEQKVQRRRKEAEEAEQKVQLMGRRLKAALVVQRYWRGYMDRKRAASWRGRLTGASVVLQCRWRQVISCRAAATAQKLQEAALTIQSLWRASQCRKQLFTCRLEAFRRRRAARCIERHYWAYRNRWQLGPLKMPSVHAGSENGNLVIDTASLLSKPLRVPSGRLRSVPKEEGDAGDAASRHRVVVTTKQRGAELSEEEREKRGDLHNRARMASSSYRGTPGAMQAMKKTGSSNKTS